MNDPNQPIASVNFKFDSSHTLISSLQGVKKLPPQPMPPLATASATTLPPPVMPPPPPLHMPPPSQTFLYEVCSRRRATAAPAAGASRPPPPPPPRPAPLTPPAAAAAAVAAGRLLDLKRQTLRNHQQQCCDLLMNNRDVVLVAGTGAGKSLCYQLPGLARAGVCIVVSPLVALMQDQVQALRRRGLRAEYLAAPAKPTDTADGGGGGGPEGGETAEAAYALAPGLELLIGGESMLVPDPLTLGDFNDLVSQFKSPRTTTLDYLYITPERLSNSFFQSQLRALACTGCISLIVFDEAHCITEWGCDFRPSYYQAARVVRTLAPTVPIIAATATAGTSLREQIADILQLRRPHYVTTTFTRTNLSYAVLPIRTGGRAAAAAAHIIRTLFPGQPGIVYQNSHDGVEGAAAELRGQGVHCLHYHAGMHPEARTTALKQWMAGSVPVAVATKALGMGVDHPGVRFVIHLSPPDSLAAWAQEAGRAGRDGQKAVCIVLVHESGYNSMRYFSGPSVTAAAAGHASAAAEAASDNYVAAMNIFGGGPVCLRVRLAAHFDEKVRPCSPSWPCLPCLLRAGMAGVVRFNAANLATLCNSILQTPMELSTLRVALSRELNRRTGGGAGAGVVVRRHSDGKICRPSSREDETQVLAFVLSTDQMLEQTLRVFIRDRCLTEWVRTTTDGDRVTWMFGKGNTPNEVYNIELYDLRLPWIQFYVQEMEKLRQNRG